LKEERETERKQNKEEKETNKLQIKRKETRERSDK
jgi:hypothetical protein